MSGMFSHSNIKYGNVWVGNEKYQNQPDEGNILTNGPNNGPPWPMGKFIEMENKYWRNNLLNVASDQGWVHMNYEVIGKT